jgi:hypothetical protein
MYWGLVLRIGESRSVVGNCILENGELDCLSVKRDMWRENAIGKLSVVFEPDGA